jgi:hypothetical protein
MKTSRWAALALVGAIAGSGVVAMDGCGNQASSNASGQGGGSDATAGDGAGPGNSSGANSSGASSGANSSGASSGANSSGASGDDGGGASSGTSSGTSSGGACVPITACPSTVTCGRYTDPCSGSVFICGNPCASGEVCIPTPGDPTSQGCVLTGGTQGACTGLCGEIGYDACGVAIVCGGCATGLSCIANHCVTPPAESDAEATVSDACVPVTCSPNAQTQLCGTVNTGCGGTIHCTCTTGVCLGGVCTTEPPECTLVDGGAKCGTVNNACGSGTLSCAGTCTGTTTCGADGTCTACTPPSCGSKTCGSVSNGCGPSVSCGTCASSSETCYQGSCCTPSTCTQILEAGTPDGGALGCESVSLGCGVTQVCSPCPGGEVCNANACCTPKTCAEAMDAGLVTSCTPIDLGCGITQTCAPCPGGETCNANACMPCVAKTCADFDGGCHSDGCNGTLDCCGSGLSCQGSLCCASGMVNYNGSCCLPQCDTSQPAGVQISCGQSLYCGGGR